LFGLGRPEHKLLYRFGVKPGGNTQTEFGKVAGNPLGKEK